MSKKRTGLWIAFGAVLGAAAAGISYYLKYKSFNDELEQDFHDYEEEEDAKEEKNSGLCVTQALFYEILLFLFLHSRGETPYTFLKALEK